MLSSKPSSIRSVVMITSVGRGRQYSEKQGIKDRTPCRKIWNLLYPICRFDFGSPEVSNETIQRFQFFGLIIRFADGFGNSENFSFCKFPGFGPMFFL
jgi:hypothetical protein